MQTYICYQKLRTQQLRDKIDQLSVRDEERYNILDEELLPVVTTEGDEQVSATLDRNSGESFSRLYTCRIRRFAINRLHATSVYNAAVNLE